MPLMNARRKPDDTIPTSSMADIAFLLLVFFLVTTVFPKDRGLALVLPEQDTPTEISPGNILFFFVAGSGMVEVLPGGAQQSFLVRPDDVEGVWRQRVAERPTLVAALKTHPEAPYGSMIDVLDALQRAGADRISLQVDER